MVRTERIHIFKEALINEDFCSLARKVSSGRSEVYQDIHELRTGRT